MQPRLTLVLLFLVASAGCQKSRDHAAELAVAKCSTPVQSQAHTGQNLEQLVAKRLPQDRRQVTGVVHDGAGAEHDFVCVVAPDASDKLRGLKIESLSISEAAQP